MGTIKLLAMLLLTVVGFFNLLLSPFLPEKPERTDWMVNGRYRGFFYADHGMEKTMEHLLELAEAGDTEKIREAFRPKFQEAVGEEQLQALTAFLTQEVAAWEADTRFYSRENSVVSQSMDFILDTAEGPYRFRIRDRITDSSAAEDVGFTNLLLCPEAIYYEYAPLQEPGIYIVYQKDPQGSDPMETLMTLAEAGDEEGLWALFSPSVQEKGDRTEGPALLAFLREEVISWEPCAWIEARGEEWGDPYVRWEQSFLLHTAAEDWRCTIRGVTEDRWPEDVGLYNITVFPHCGEDVWESETYQEYCCRGREEPGLLLASGVYDE